MRSNIGTYQAAELAYALGEAEAELARHHRDFERIVRLVDCAFDHEDPFGPWDALREIRGIVG